MRLKTLVISVVVLAALSAGVFLLRRPAPPPSSDPRLNQPIVDAKVVDSAARLRFTDQGKTVLLVRQADGTWRVPSYHDMPADFGKLSTFVGTLTEARIQRLVTSNAERVARLEFKDTKIELLDGSEKVIWTITLGKNPETGGGRFVRFGDEQKAYVASLNAWLDTEPKNWANTELLNLKADDVAKVEVSLPEGGPVTVSRPKKEDPWTAGDAAGGQKVKADKVASLLASLGNIRFSETTAPDDAAVAVAKANLRTYKLTTFDNKIITVALGRKPEEKKLKPPTATADGKSGPAALGSLSDLAKKDEKKEVDAKDGEKKGDDAKPLAPEFETIPAGPVFVFITHSDASAPLNALMQKRAFQIPEYVFTGLPQKAEDLFEAAAPAAPAEAKPDVPKP
ncbi:MAG TPA: DUF4340 domain-containing protein [Opitutaceae bacterium]|nr:DUF4340 domain-containing protein [Opitutaceae bacterium]